MTTSITAIAATDANAKALRVVNKYGMNLADFAALTTGTSYSAFGNGTGYTVSNWISDGMFANLAAVQSVYPIVQSGSDTVDWVLLQSAIDFMIYGSLGSSVYGSTKRKLFIPAGLFQCNHPLQIGYAAIGTPPANLNGNGYVSITLEGEGPHYDPSGNGMTGTTIYCAYTDNVGIAVNKGVQIIIRGMHVKGGYTYLYSNGGTILASASAWDVASYKDPALSSTNWIGGSAVGVGIAIDPYSSVGSAAAYPARILPSYFGGGTTTARFSTAGGSDCTLEDVNISNFVIGYGRVHGDNNGEFLRHHRGTYSNCVYPIAMGHSQNRNVSIRDLNMGYFHTGITNLGGTQSNGNLHGAYENIHAAYGYQVFNHDNGGWSGPISIDGLYMEGTYSIGNFTSNRLTIRNGLISFIDQDGYNTSPKYHFTGSALKLEDTSIGTRQGLFVSSLGHNPCRVILDNSSISSSGYGSDHTTNTLNAFRYMNGVFGRPGTRGRTVTCVSVSGGAEDIQHPNGCADGASFCYTHVGQDKVVYASGVGDETYGSSGADTLLGPNFSYNVPKIGYRQIYLGTCASRSGKFVTFTRAAFGVLKADVGDIFYIGDTFGEDNIFVVSSISGGNMVLMQQNNYYSSGGPTDYATNGQTQVTAGAAYNAIYICTRIMNNKDLVLGESTSGTATISKVKRAFGSGNAITTTHLTMAAGDLFIHSEPDMLNVGGSPVSPLNIVTNVNTTAQTITLTNNFKTSNTCYPVVFYVKVFNA